MVKLPDHCSGKLSQLLNALALLRAVLGLLDDAQTEHELLCDIVLEDDDA